MIALMRAIGATYEPVNEGLLMGAIRWPSQFIAIGVVLPSVMPKVGTPRSRALSTDSTVSLRQRPKLIAITRSSLVSASILCWRFPALPTGA